MLFLPVDNNYKKTIQQNHREVVNINLSITKPSFSIFLYYVFNGMTRMTGKIALKKANQKEQLKLIFQTHKTVRVC